MLQTLIKPRGPALSSCYNLRLLVMATICADTIPALAVSCGRRRRPTPPAPLPPPPPRLPPLPAPAPPRPPRPPSSSSSSSF